MFEHSCPAGGRGENLEFDLYFHGKRVAGYSWVEILKNSKWLSLCQALVAAALIGSGCGRRDPWKKAISGAPPPIQRLVEVSLAVDGDPVSFPQYLAAREDVHKLGQDAVPWLIRLLNVHWPEGNPRPRGDAAEILGDLGRWGEVLEALDSPHFEIGIAASSPFTIRLLNARRNEVESFLPRIQAIAANSKNDKARTIAMNVLSFSSDRALSGPCVENLAYDSRDFRLAVIASGAVALSWRRFNLMCVSDDRDQEVRNHAIRCLKRLEVPGAVEELLEIASMNNQKGLRHEALEALGAIAKRDFGTATPHDKSHAHVDWTRGERCEARRKEAVKALGGSTSSPEEAVAGIDRAVAGLRRDNLADSSRNPDAEIVEGWLKWANSPEVRRAAGPFSDNIIAQRRFEGGLAVAMLYSSGQVNVAGVIPVIGKRPGVPGGATYQSLESLEYAIAEMMKMKGITKTDDGMRVARWLREEAIPALQGERKEKRIHAARD